MWRFGLPSNMMHHDARRDADGSVQKTQRTRGQANDLECCPSASDTKGLSKYPLGCAMDRLSLRHLSSLLHYIVAHARLCALMAVSPADSVGLIAPDLCVHRLFSKSERCQVFLSASSFLPSALRHHYHLDILITACSYLT